MYKKTKLKRGNMSILRGKSQKKTTILELQEVTKARDHQLLDFKRGQVNPDTVPKQSVIKIHCNKCNNEWETKAYVYLERTGPAQGCRRCYENLLQDPTVYPNVPCRAKEPTRCSDGAHRRDKVSLQEAFEKGPF
jgi:hypothetical protein